LLLDLLLVARVLLARGWCQGANARNAEGEILDTSAPEAAQWSLLGALYCASVELLPYKTTPHQLRYRLLDEVAEFLWQYLPLADRKPGARLALGTWAAAPERQAADILALLDLAVDDVEDERQLRAAERAGQQD
jgi:hypothetical protein